MNTSRGWSAGEWAFRSNQPQRHTLAMLGLQRDTAMIAAFVRTLRKRLARAATRKKTR
ncbi:hypothetical protein [Breoghania sp.]|uniref:hypothetical protein n=1 Tax=Breoghania sp. TaxID=2065378 RepID=UPI00261F5329|nr:hypothetical protein [Breoghania sp.]MDJ0930131.1 hypothetical protein [Breoghania sp.]